MLELLIATPDGERSLRINELPFRIGRQSDNTLVLTSWRVARHHAQIEHGPDGIRICDLDSLAGTWLNGKRLKDCAPLTLGDGIQIANACLRVIAFSGLGRSRESINDSDWPTTRPSLVVTATTVASAAIQASAQITDDQRTTTAQLRRTLHRSLLETIDLRRTDIRQLSAPQLRDEVRTILASILAGDPQFASIANNGSVLDDVLNEAVGLGPLERLLADPGVTEIMVNGASDIFCERAGRIEQSDAFFSSEQAVRAVIERIVAPLGRRIDESAPMVDARLPDGSRVNAVLPPLALRGPAITIRKFNRQLLTPGDLLAMHTLDNSMMEFLAVCVRHRRSIAVSGGTGSGKTTLLNVLASLIPASERIVTIEDAAELSLPHRNLVALEARPANAEGKGAVVIRDLVRNALRMRPDRIVVGECRGGEALDMLQAMNTGHDGSLTTLHANGVRDALARLETMALMAGIDLPAQSIREQIASAVNIIIHQARLPDGCRRIVEIAEVTGIEGARIQTQTLFRSRAKVATSRSDFNRVADAACWTFERCDVVPRFYESLAANGHVPDLSIFCTSSGRIATVNDELTTN